MLYLTGASTRFDRPVAHELVIGLMAQPGNGHCRGIPHYPYWAADNGCYARGAAFNLDRYLAWLDRLRPWQETCLFATAPDVVGDAAATLAARYAVAFPLAYQEQVAPDDALADIEDLERLGDAAGGLRLNLHRPAGRPPRASCQACRRLRRYFRRPSSGPACATYGRRQDA